MLIIIIHGSGFRLNSFILKFIYAKLTAEIIHRLFANQTKQSSFFLFCDTFGFFRAAVFFFILFVEKTNEAH